jgi:hypothetical protein
MGVSTDAILAYGVDLGDDIDLDWLEDVDDIGEALESRLLEKLAGFTDEWTDGDETYFDRKQAAEEKTGVEIEYHCSYDYPMYFLAARGSVTRANRGYPQKVPTLLSRTRYWDESLLEAQKALGLEVKTPGWYLFSMWG